MEERRGDEAGWNASLFTIPSLTVPGHVFHLPIPLFCLACRVLGVIRDSGETKDQE